MSIDSFVHYGSNRRLLGVKHSETYGPIKLYDIGEQDCVGAAYEDGARQAQPLRWQGVEIERKLAASLKQEPETRARLTPAASKPTLPKRAVPTSRPRLPPAAKRK